MPLYPHPLLSRSEKRKKRRKRKKKKKTKKIRDMRPGDTVGCPCIYGVMKCPALGARAELTLKLTDARYYFTLICC